MKLKPKELFLLCQNAISAAVQAGHLISKKVGHKVAAQHKIAGNTLASQVVTEVDLLSQEIILQSLTPSCEMFDLALLTEETADDHLRLEKDYFWCIDPLDGTLAFLDSGSGFAVSIALVSREGIPHIGVIYDPVEQTLYYAVKGQGAFRNSKPWQLSAVSAGKPLTVVMDRSFSSHHLFNVCMDKIKLLAGQSGYNGINIINHGGAVMNACWVPEKAPALYFKLPKPEAGGGSLWDFAATACLLSELGAPAGDCSGGPLDLNRPDSTFMNHRGVLFASAGELAEEVFRMLREL